MKRSGTLLFLMLLASPACASDSETFEATVLPPENGVGGAVIFNGSCGEECHAATLGCGEGGEVIFTFADVEAKDAANAITREAQEFSIEMGGSRFGLTIMNLQYGGEMYGTWNVEGAVGPSDSADFLAVLGKTKDFTARLGKDKLTLPVTDQVKAWAGTCKP